MLVLSRKLGERIMIGDRIVVSVVKLSNGQVHLTSFSDPYATAESVRSSISRHSGDGDSVPEVP
jgi:carbon storage regulator CsrA